MSTILLYGIGGALLLAILLSLPLLKHLTKPVMDAILKGAGLFFVHTGSYLVWMGKSVIRAHVIVFQHLLHRKKYFDPTDGMEKK